MEYTQESQLKHMESKKWEGLCIGNSPLELKHFSTIGSCHNMFYFLFG